MRILIAGGAGFLGSHLADALVAENNDVIIVDNLSSGLLENLNNVKKEIKFIKADVTENIDIKEKLDLVINMASNASRVEWETHPVAVALANSLGSNNLIKLAISKKARYIYASTSEIYGNPEIVPTPETYMNKLDHLGSRAPYDESKKFGETLVRAYESEFDLQSVIIRFFNTYGPRMRGGDFYGRVIDRFMKQALAGEPLTIYGDGTQTRSFTYVSDTVAAIMLLIRKGKSGEIYNIGASKELKIKDLAKMVKEITNSKSRIVNQELPSDDPKRRGADSRKIAALGWSPKVDVREGLQEMLKFYKLSDK